MQPFRLSFEDILDIYVTLEENIQLDNLVAQHQKDVRDVRMLLDALQGFLNYNISVLEVDFYKGLDSSQVGRSRDFFSLIHIFSAESKSAEIAINSHILPDGAPLVNYCWRRFCTIKEACQIIIRAHFYENDIVYPDSVGEEKQSELLHNIFRYKFSIEDFESDKYPPDVKVENAAEILAILLLYPIEKMVVDKKDINSSNHFGVYNHAYFNIADRYKIPERYVDLFLSSENLDDIKLRVDEKLYGASVYADGDDSEDSDNSEGADVDAGDDKDYTDDFGPKIQ